MSQFRGCTTYSILGWLYDLVRPSPIRRAIRPVSVQGVVRPVKISTVVRPVPTWRAVRPATVRRAIRPVPVQPVTTVPAAGTDVFERRRKKRVERLKFRWIRQQLSGKGRGRRRQRTSSSSSCSGDDARPRSDSVFEDDDVDVAMTTTSGTLGEPRPSTSHVITINGATHQ